MKVLKIKDFKFDPDKFYKGYKSPRIRKSRWWSRQTGWDSSQINGLESNNQGERIHCKANEEDDDPLREDPKHDEKVLGTNRNTV
jgi:hypothetical protein